jgi:hypothetical protein
MPLNEVYARILDPQTSTPVRFDLLMGEARSLWSEAARLGPGAHLPNLQAWALFNLGLSTLILLENGDLNEAFEGSFTPRAQTFYGRWWQEFRARGGSVIAHSANPHQRGLVPVRRCLRNLIRLRRVLGPPPWNFHVWPTPTSLHPTSYKIHVPGTPTKQGRYALLHPSGVLDVCGHEPLAWKSIEQGRLHPGGRDPGGKWWTRLWAVPFLVYQREPDNVPLWRMNSEKESGTPLPLDAKAGECLEFQQGAELKLACKALRAELYQASAFALALYRLFPDPRRGRDPTPWDQDWVAALPLRVHAHLPPKVSLEAQMELTRPSDRRAFLDYMISGLRERGWQVWEYEGSQKVLVMPASWGPGVNPYEAHPRLRDHFRELMAHPDKPNTGWAPHIVTFKLINPALSMVQDRDGSDMSALP